MQPVEEYLITSLKLPESTVRKYIDTSLEVHCNQLKSTLQLVKKYLITSLKLPEATVRKYIDTSLEVH